MTLCARVRRCAVTELCVCLSGDFCCARLRLVPPRPCVRVWTLPRAHTRTRFPTLPPPSRPPRFAPAHTLARIPSRSHTHTHTHNTASFSAPLLATPLLATPACVCVSRARVPSLVRVWVRVVDVCLCVDPPACVYFACFSPLSPPHPLVSYGMRFPHGNKMQ